MLKILEADFASMDTRNCKELSCSRLKSMINLGLSCVKLSTKWSKVYFNSIWQCSLDLLKLDRLVDGQVEALLSLVILSKPELNHKSTQPQSLNLP